MSNIHRSKELDQFLGQKVRVTFWNDHVYEGILYWSKRDYPEQVIPREDYSVDNMHFYKTHVKKIEKI